MKRTQKVYNEKYLIEKILYSQAVWSTLSEAQQELIYMDADW